MEDFDSEAVVDIDVISQLHEFLKSSPKQEDTTNELIQNLNKISLKDVNLTQKELLNLCRLSITSIDWLGIQFRIMEDYSITSNYLSLHRDDSIQFQIFKKFKSDFTIQTWFQINGNESDSAVDDDNEFMTILEIPSLLYLKMLNNKLVVSLIDENKRERQGVFDSFNFELNTPYHLVLTHTGITHRNGSRFNLYIDGEFIQSVQVNSDTTLFSTYSQPLYAILCNKGSSAARVIDFVNLLIVNEVQPLEWILLSYYLTPDYSGTYSDNNLTEVLSYRSRSVFELKLKELYLHSSLSKKGKSDVAQQKFEDFSRQELLKFEQVHGLLIKSGKLNLSLEHIVLHFNSKHSYISNGTLIVPYQGDNRATITESPSLWKSLPIQSVFYSIGGITIAFKTIEASSTNDQLCLSLNFLFEAVSKDWRNLKELEMRNGYDLLATLLKTKKSLIDLKVLDLILRFIGYDYNSPIDSILINASAYRSLILDFDIWKLDGDDSTANKETFKFLLFQFTVFFQESKYNLYNINKLVKMRVIKRFIQALKYESFGKEMLSAVHSSLLILIKANPSSEIMKALSMYIIYALNKDKPSTESPQHEESLQRLCGLSALDVLASYICDSSLVNSSLASSSNSANSNLDLFYKKLARTISVRWILLLLDDPNREVVKLSLRLLVRMLSITGLKYYNNFMRHNGLDILTNLLRNRWNDNELIVILFSGAFGISQVQNLGSDLPYFCERLSKRGERLMIVMPEFLYLINNMLLYGIDAVETSHSSKSANNEPAIHDDLAFHLASFLNSFSRSLDITLKKVSCLHSFYSKDVHWMTGYLHILSRLETMANEATTTEILSAKALLIENFSNFTIELLFKESVGGVTFDHFMSAFNERQAEMTIIRALIYPNVLDHLVNFKDMLPELFKSQKWLKSNILKFVGSYSESKFHDNGDAYFGYVKVLDIIFEIDQTKQSDPENLSKLRVLAANCFFKEYQYANDLSYLKRLTKELLFHQELYFHADAMNPQKLGEFIKRIFKNCKQYADSELRSISINALRMIIIYRQNDLNKIIDAISLQHHNLVAQFFEDLLSFGDQDIIERISEPSLSAAFEIEKSVGEYIDFVKDLSDVNQAFDVIKDPKTVKDFEADNSKWKVTITSSETAKYSRHMQDYEDNLQFYISVYNKMRQESTRLLYGFADLEIKWVVDSIECENRMRRRIVPEIALSGYSNFFSEATGGNAKSRTVTTEPSISSATLSSSVASMELEESFEMVEDPGDSEAIQEDKNRKVLRSLYVGDKILDLWNVSQILGLESVESIFILSNSHLYIVENYFHSSNGEVLDINDAPANERDPYMQLILGPRHTPPPDKSNKNTKSWELDKLTSISKRQFLLRDVALEFFFSDGSSFLLTCINRKVRDSMYSKLSHLATWKGVDPELSQALKLSTSSLANGNGAPKLFGFNISQAFSNHSLNSLATTKKWQRGEISNFYYLILINTLAGRTFNDLTQYPVFPWVIADYTSEELDLNDPKTFRDLTKPMGGQGAQRESTFIERYEALASLNDPESPPFHYGTHYSSAMIVTHFLIRLEPYVQSNLLLQGGKFDHADRLFYSIAKAWHSASKENTTDVRELIPEFFYLPEFLENSNHFDFGQLQDGETVGDVILPPWAKGDPKIFVQKNREALESPYVSSHLHEWIDLIFGFKQTGRAAIDATNVFHHLSYNGAIDLDKIEDDTERKAMTGIIHNFGQTPLQLFNKPHPAREVLSYPKLSADSLRETPVSITEPKTEFVVNKVELSTKDKVWKGRPKIFSNDDNLCIRSSETIGALLINGNLHENLHSAEINVLVSFGQKMFITGAKDGTIHIWKYIVGANSSSGNVTVARREAMSKFLELKHNTFDFQAVLRGHLSAVVDIKVAPSFNSAVSLDEEGHVYLWDLVRLSIIRKIRIDCLRSKVTGVSIANDTGDIILFSKTEVAVLTINGELFLSTKLYEEGVEETEINVVEFAQSNWNSPRQGSSVHHEYWQRTSIIAVGVSSRIDIFELAALEGEWKLNQMKTISIPADNTKNKITAIRLILRSTLDEHGRKVGSGKLICGDEKGKVYAWQ